MSRRRYWSDDRGSGTLWLLGVALAVLVLLVSTSMLGGLMVARHRAEAAADLGALAGAQRAVDGSGDACTDAARIVRANGARLVACRLEGFDVIVTAAVDGPGGWGTAEGSARAGPERAGVLEPAAGLRTGSKKGVDASPLPRLDG